MGKQGTVKSLYVLTERDVNSEVAIAYSRMKLGDAKTINAFARRLGKLIRKTTEKLDQIPHAVTHVPTIVTESGIHYITEKISHLLPLPAFELKRRTHSFNYQLFSARLRRKKTQHLIDYTGESLVGEDIVLLDDCMVTGMMLQSCARTLKANGAGGVAMYTLLDIRTVKPGIESRIETAFYRVKGVGAVINLLDDAQNVPTNFVVTFIYNLPRVERKLVLNALQARLKRWIGKTVRSFPANTPLARSELRDL